MSYSLAKLVQSSNLPAGPKSTFVKWAEELRDGGGVIAVRDRAKAHGLAAVNVVREYGESGFTGAMLGFAHAHLAHGLDIPVNGGTHEIPVDFAAAAGLAMLSVAFPLEPSSVDARHIGAGCAAVFGFRKTFANQQTKITAAGGHVGGTFAGESANDSDEEPLLRLARKTMSRSA